MKVDTSNPLWRFRGVTSAAMMFFAYLYLPIVVLIALSFNENRLATIWTGFTTDWYLVALGNDDMLRAAGNSLIIAVSATVIATLAATLAALGMSSGNRFRGEAGVAAMLALPLLVPEIVTAVATLLFFVALGVKLGLLSVIVAHTVFCIPFAYLPIRARLEGMDPSLTEAAHDLYANEWKAFRRVTLPLLWPGIMSGAMLSFIISLDDFVISYFVGGAGATTLPIYIFGMIRMGITPEVNAVSALMLLVSILFVSVSFLIDRIRY
ncbi:ABC transporter permease [Thalassospira alkalitolerans]|uniref:Spermidine/putrescine transport system permease protein PotC n=1 Tax=Thalassospira alkalitolerans TaxID=1293890 RepID=A0A1Y2LAJ7_9PROT|nr:ABC transporter permease [Thalassospira alkalitolerans]OSQ46725.1 ABC transporter permease [Thalassospira alkalitolerans]|tara:strand:- start:104954 stop:105751 length:798 start_codon:yes stop_codon:yes gene_type:complete